MAHKYKSSKVFWGYDLVNEPIEGAVPEDLLDWQEPPRPPQRLSGPSTPTMPSSSSPARAAVLTAWRDSSPWTCRTSSIASTCTCRTRLPTRAYTGARRAVSYPGLIDGKMCDKAQLEAALKPVIDFQKNYGVPIYIGEFSAIRWAPDSSAYRYLRHVLDIFEKHGWDWSYHAFREWPGWSVEHSDDEHCQEPTAVPNDRQKLLRQWFAKNQKPRWQGREPSPAVVNPALRSPLRETLSLNGAWDFCTDPKLQGEAAGWHLPGKVLAVRPSASGARLLGGARRR